MTWGVDGLTVRFGPRVALESVSLTAAPSQVTCVVGGDGAGKTTLLRALVGVVRADAGEVQRPDARRIGYLPSGSGTYADLTVEENLQFSAGVFGLPTGTARQRIDSYLERTGLQRARARLAGQLSGGMRQKLGVVRAMLHHPDLLVLDEPTTGVDPVSRADIWWLIARAAADGAAVVVATTYVDEAARASAVLLLESGHALVAGRPSDIVAAVPGVVSVASSRPSGGAASRAWRRGSTWRLWSPDGTSDADAGSPVTADLTDAVVVAALARELAFSGGPP